MKVNRFGKKYCKIVLTGGPCAGEYQSKLKMWVVRRTLRFLWLLNWSEMTLITTSNWGKWIWNDPCWIHWWIKKILSDSGAGKLNKISSFIYNYSNLSSQTNPLWFQFTQFTSEKESFGSNPNLFNSTFFTNSPVYIRSIP